MEAFDESERLLHRQILGSKGIKPKKLRQISKEQFLVLADIGCSVAYVSVLDRYFIWTHIQAQLSLPSETVKKSFLRQRRVEHYSDHYCFWTGVGDEQDDPS